MELSGSMITIILEPFSYVIRAGERVYWVYLYSAIVIAFVVYLQKTDKRGSLAGFLAYCFPGHIWRHRSTRTDVFYFVTNRILFLALFTPFILLMFPRINNLTHDFLSLLTLPRHWEASDAIVGLYAVCVVLMVDFVQFIAHYFQHRVDFLWQFHKVHHSALVLTPMTVYRMHPVDDLLALCLGSVCLGFLHGLFSFFFINDLAFWTFGNVTLVSMLFYVTGYNLRHSHIWLSYGRRVSHWLMSPAQHQIHHSCRPEHLDKNLGLMFAFWDRWFGTLYVPERQEDLEIGLSDEPVERFSNPLKCYLEPFRSAFSRHRATTVLLTLCLAGTASLSVAQVLIEPNRVHGLQLANHTWKEVQSLLDQGYQTIIVPTGGIEQNGEHLILGKHGKVVGHAAEQIAQRLGKTLVAPIIDFVPEGNIDPPDGHMPFAGTISVRESTFEAVLEDTARSLAQHGFRRICFVGDSGWNQKPQARVAERLNQEFAGRDVRVLHVGDYYSANGQKEWLASEGFDEEQIGGHAGVRDSSELLFTDPQGIRFEALRASGQRNGVSGSYWKATEDIGRKMIELKVTAALNEIEGKW